MGKIIAGKTSDIPPGKMIKISIDGRDIMVANIDGDIVQQMILVHIQVLAFLKEN